MGFRFRRSVKILPGIRLNFGKRGISTSIGVRGAHVTFGSAGTRTTVGIPGSGLSYTHLERPHRATVPAATAQPMTDTAETVGAAAPPGSARRGFLWIGLLLAACVIFVQRLTSPAAPPQLAAPTPVNAVRASTTGADLAREASLAEIRMAALGLARIRQRVANSNTLQLSWVKAMPKETVCFQFKLRNSRGVPYVRNAALQGATLTISGSADFAGVWNSRCAKTTEGRDITSDVRLAAREELAVPLRRP